MGTEANSRRAFVQSTTISHEVERTKVPRLGVISQLKDHALDYHNDFSDVAFDKTLCDDFYPG